MKKEETIYRYLPAQYLSSFDTSISAYPYDYGDESDHWWRCEDGVELQRTIALAKPISMLSLLYGQSIVLSQSQAIDSAAWLDLFTEMDDKLDWNEIYSPTKNGDTAWDEEFMPNKSQINSPFVLSLYKEEKPTPDKLVKVFADQLENSDFKMSAWPWLKNYDQDRRANIADEIINKKDETSTFGSILGKLSIRHHNAMMWTERQSESLDRFYEHLSKRGRLVKAVDVSKELSLKEEVVKRCKNDGVNRDFLEEIIKKVEVNENSRSVWYGALAEMGVEEETTKTVKHYVDRSYNDIIAASVTSRLGSGEYNALNRATETSEELAELNEKNEKADETMDSEGRIDNGVTISINKDVKRFTSTGPTNPLTWKDVNDYLKDEDNKRKIGEFHQEMRQDPEKAKKKYDEHLSEFLSTKLTIPWVLPVQYKGGAIAVLLMSQAPYLLDDPSKAIENLQTVYDLFTQLEVDPDTSINLLRVACIAHIFRRYLRESSKIVPWEPYNPTNDSKSNE